MQVSVYTLQLLNEVQGHKEIHAQLPCSVPHVSTSLMQIKFDRPAVVAAAAACVAAVLATGLSGPERVRQYHYGADVWKALSAARSALHGGQLRHPALRLVLQMLREVVHARHA